MNNFENTLIREIYSNSLAKPDETLYEHTKLLLDNFELLKNLGYLNSNIKDIEEILYLSCLYHDMGKINPVFQERLKNKNKFDKNIEVGHNILSACLVNLFLDNSKDNKLKNNLVRVAILNHHNYIENFTFLNEGTNETVLFKNLKEINNKFFIEETDIFLKTVRKTKKIRTIDEMKAIVDSYEYIIIKGLLNKCDYAASAHMKCEIKNDFLLNSLESLNYNWRHIQQFCMENRNDNLVIVGSTGLGKTEASLLWGADNKIFYVLPLRTAINAMYERIKNVVQNDYDKKVAVLHGQTDSVYLKELNSDLSVKNENEKFYEYYKNTKKLAMPITVATPDQLFDSVFKYNGYEFKMATFSYSKIIIDEIQAYSPDILAYTIYAIRLINDLGGKIAIFTATLAPFVKDLLTKKSSITSEYKFKDFEYKYECFLSENKRHSMKIIEKELDTEYVEKILNKRGNIRTCLIVRNTIKSAQELYNQLNNDLDCSKYEVNLLHSKFTVEDRKQKEVEILQDGDPKNVNDKIKVWISTQIVEASLDIDFDIMFTELSELLGLFQRFGRVYRKRTLESDIPNIYVFTEISEKQISSPYNTYEFLLKFLEIFNIKKATFIGHSFGGKTLTILGARNNDLIDKLVIIDASGVLPKRKLSYYTKVYSFKAAKKLYMLTHGNNEEALEKFYKNHGSDDYQAADGIMRKCFVKVVNESTREEFKNIETETLLIWGDRDEATPLYMGKIFEEEIKNSGLVVLEDAGHYSYLDKFSQFSAVINSFLD